MKKVISLFLVLSLIFAFAACGKEKGGTETDAAQEDAVSVSLKADKTEVSPGDSLKVTVNVSGSSLFACTEIHIPVPSDVKITDEKTFASEDLQSLCNVENNMLKISAVTLKTIAVQDTDIAEFTVTVSETAESGDVLEFTPELVLFQEGTDETGDETVEIKDSVKNNGISIKVL